MLRTVNIVLHNPAHSSSDNIPPLTYRQSPSLGCCLAEGRGCINRQNRSNGVTCGREQETNERHRKKPDSGKLAIHPDHPRCHSAIYICMCDHIPEVVIHSKFHQNLFEGFGATGCRTLPPLIDLAGGVGLY